MHKEVIDKYHDDIINAMIEACNTSISYKRSKVHKSVPGWNEYVHSYFQTALFWHILWKENGEPKAGVIAEIRKQTRSLYHKAYKMVVRYENEIRLQKVEDSFVAGSEIDMWRKLKKTKKKPMMLPQNVDNVSGTRNIANTFVDKFKSLYNIVGFSDNEINELNHSLADNIRKVCSCKSCVFMDDHAFSPSDVGMAIKKLKSNKSDGDCQLMSNHIINGGDRLRVHISLLFTEMFRHGHSSE